MGFWQYVNMNMGKLPWEMGDVLPFTGLWMCSLCVYNPDTFSLLGGGPACLCDMWQEWGSLLCLSCSATTSLIPFNRPSIEMSASHSVVALACSMHGWVSLTQPVSYPLPMSFCL